jgi:hypothetical protein
LSSYSVGISQSPGEVRSWRRRGAGDGAPADWGFLLGLRDVGRATAGEWLSQQFDSLGRRSTVDIQVTYL